MRLANTETAVEIDAGLWRDLAREETLDFAIANAEERLGLVHCMSLRGEVSIGHVIFEASSAELPRRNQVRHQLFGGNLWIDIQQAANRMICCQFLPFAGSNWPVRLTLY